MSDDSNEVFFDSVLLDERGSDIVSLCPCLRLVYCIILRTSVSVGIRQQDSTDTFIGVISVANGLREPGTVSCSPYIIFVSSESDLHFTQAQVQTCLRYIHVLFVLASLFVGALELLNIRPEAFRQVLLDLFRNSST